LENVAFEPSRLCKSSMGLERLTYPEFRSIPVTVSTAERNPQRRQGFPFLKGGKYVEL
jgi:hypothetical protein